MFIFVQNFKSNKKPEYLMNECSGEVEAARQYALKLLASSVDVTSVEIFEHLASATKVESVEWN